MTRPLIVQAAIHMLRKRLGEPFSNCDAEHFAKDFFRGLDGYIILNLIFVLNDFV